jgi:alanine dehydrogenase
VGATALQMNHGGKGLLLGGVPGVGRAKSPLLEEELQELKLPKWLWDLALR